MIINKNKFISYVVITFTLSILSFNVLAEAPKAKILQKSSNINPKVLALGVKAYNHAREKGLDKKGVLTIIDYSKPSSEPRLWVINMNTGNVPIYTYVAHGQGSGNNYAKHFSNNGRSYQSSLGVFLTGQTYHGKHDYSLRLIGLEKGYNDHAYRRAIVMHSAWYVSKSFLHKYGRLGRSWGCPAISEKMHRQVINKIKDGTIIFAYYPDRGYLNHSRYLV